jgi:hypothetical protein
MQVGRKNTIAKFGGIGNKLTIQGQIGRKLAPVPRMRINYDILNHGLTHQAPSSGLEKASKSS